MAEMRNPDGSLSIGILEDIKPAQAAPKDEPKEEPAEKPKKKAAKKK